MPAHTGAFVFDFYPHRMITSYAERFQQQADVAAYEAAEYGVTSYATAIWQLQRPLLENLVKDFRAAQVGPVRLLDFACGTGRVLSALAPLVDSADGVDISENMVAVARGKCPKARLLVGDMLARPELLQPTYDLITCFRFVLNAEPRPAPARAAAAAAGAARAGRIIAGQRAWQFPFPAASGNPLAALARARQRWKNDA